LQVPFPRVAGSTIAAQESAVKLINRLRTWWQERTGEEETPFDGDSPTFMVSLVFHIALMVVLALITVPIKDNQIRLTITTPNVKEKVEELQLPEEFYFSELPSEQVGANSNNGAEMALSLAPVVSEISAIPTPQEVEVATDVNQFEINNMIVQATGLNYSANLAVKGAAGQGTTGAAGAIDRLTHEILLSLEERKTLVVWLFDQSPSMIKQRSEVRDRFEKVYQELGVIEAANNPAFAKHSDKPLLTSVVSFGDKVTLLTKKPTDNLSEIHAAIDSIEMDLTGIERIFSAIYMSANEYKGFRVPKEGTKEPERNVMIIAFTDEAGDDQEGLDQTVQICRRYEIPVYVVGVPAPFGQKETMVKWVDPDPMYDQTPAWGAVDQGPETFLPERIKLNFAGSREEEDPIDSGFGPYALTRLCYETGGIFFSVHPNRNVNRAVSRGEVDAYSAHIKHFFDPEVMRKYRPDYVSADEYLRRVSQNKARQVLVEAARASALTPMENPRYRFVKNNEADFANALSEAQKAAAKLEPKVAQLYDHLSQGEGDRLQETNIRWQAGYDLAMGRVAAVKVRTEAYNAMLAQAKTGLKFKNEKNNTWVLAPADTITVGSQLEKLAQKSRMYLERVVNDHPGTPWALLAKKELDNPLGWEWKEEFTPVNPPGMGAGNGNAPPPANDARMMLDRGPPKRPVPKL
jgi:hypothetical protein